MALVLVDHTWVVQVLLVAAAGIEACHREDIRLHETGMLTAVAEPLDSGSEERVVLDLQSV